MSFRLQQFLNTPIEDLERENLPECVASSAYDHNMLPIETSGGAKMFGFEDYGGSVIEGYDGKLGKTETGGIGGANSDVAWPLSSPYFAMGLVIIIIVLFGAAVFTRYVFQPSQKLSLLNKKN